MSLIRTVLVVCSLASTAALAAGPSCPTGWAPGPKGTPAFGKCVENGTHTCVKGTSPWKFEDGTFGCAHVAKKACGANETDATGARHEKVCKRTDYGTCSEGTMLLIKGKLRCVK